MGVEVDVVGLNLLRRREERKMFEAFFLFSFLFGFLGKPDRQDLGDSLS